MNSICKPIISYVASKVNIPLNISIVQKRESKSCRNWKNKKEFTDYVDSLYKSVVSNCYVYIKCQCGTEYVYTSKNEVPEESLVCRCGRKVIEYID